MIVLTDTNDLTRMPEHPLFSELKKHQKEMQRCLSPSITSQDVQIFSQYGGSGKDTEKSNDSCSSYNLFNKMGHTKKLE